MAVELYADDAVAMVLPEYGCLISRYAVAGTDVLWMREGRYPDRVEASPLLGEASALDFDKRVFRGGWFPMFPVSGLPDNASAQHGWAPQTAWRCDVLESSRVRCFADGAFLEGGWAQLTRTIELSARALTVTTQISNRGSGTEQYSFGEHPCFPRELFADGEVTGEEVVLVPSRPDGASGHHQWARGSVSVAGPHAALALRVEATGLTTGALWYNFGAAELPDADCFAWEPSTSRGLGIHDARRTGSLTSIRGGENHTYTVRIAHVPTHVQREDEQ